MTKFCGVIGYGESVERAPGDGVWVDQIVERKAYGDILRPARRLEEGQYLNNDITVSNTVSIVMDAYASQHFFAIRYVEWAGAKWNVPNVEVQSPRLLLTLGGVYNGPTAD
jgi:hypothetical protein